MKTVSLRIQFCKWISYQLIKFYRGDSIAHRRIIYAESKANSRRLFWGENGGPLRLCSRRTDQGGPGHGITVT